MPVSYTHLDVYKRQEWYSTGDLVSEAADGCLTFRGRLKRFVKVGGEMISLPQIESVLAAAFGEGRSEESGEQGPALDVYKRQLRKDGPLHLVIWAEAFFYFLSTLLLLEINNLGGAELGLSYTATSFLPVALMVGICAGSLLAARGKMCIRDRPICDQPRAEPLPSANPIFMADRLFA